MLSSPTHRPRKESLFPVEQQHPSSSIPFSLVRRSTKFRRECSVTTSSRVQNHSSTNSHIFSSWAPNQQFHGTLSDFTNLSAVVSCPSRGSFLPLYHPQQQGIGSLQNASDKVTILPTEKSLSLTTGQVRNIPIKQLVTPAMPLLSSSSAAASPASPSAVSPSVRPLRVAQPPPLGTAFPSCSTAMPAPPNSVSRCLPNSISVPSLPKPTVPIHRSVASVSSDIGNRTETANNSQHQPGRPNGRGERGRSRFVQMSYEELLELARNQQRQVETNEDELDERRKAVALFGVAKRAAASQSEQQQNARILMANLRAQISCDELEMVHLGKRQKEAKKLKEYNEKQSRELAQLESEYAHDEEQLRKAVSKVDSLRRQLELLYQRRAGAAEAAVIQHRQLNGEGSAEKGIGRVEKRPKASVVPFQQENGAKARPNADDIHRLKENEGKKLPSVLHQATFQPPINWRRTTPQVDQFSIKRNSMTALKRLSWVAENGGDEYLMNFVVNEQKKGRTHISFGETVPKPSSMEMPKDKERKEVNEAGKTDTTDNVTSTEHRTAFKEETKRVIGARGDQLGIPILERTAEELRNAKETEDRQTNVLFREERRADDHEKKTDQNEVGTHHPADQEITEQKEHSVGEGSEGNAPERLKNTEKGMASPMKRVAVQENAWEFHKKFAENLNNKSQNDEAEKGGETVAVERKEEKGKAREKEGDRGQSEPPQWIRERMDHKQDQGKEEEAGGDEAYDEQEWRHGRNESEQQRIDWREGERTKSGGRGEGETADEVPGEAEPSEHALSPDFEKEVEDGGSSPDEMVTDESSSSAGEETPVVFEEPDCASALNLKGILRLPNTVREESKRRVMFDLIVLFLDVAYEGQYDTLVELASKIEDISISNSEGTTALHYAICAGNSDIVKFLIENGADVNALDVDGWSPLHCAASCNNPKMLRQLIENGACPFAMTFGMSETATQLFDETLDFAVAADYMETVENCMGVLNDGRVYAAYSYEAKHGDEMSFSEGDELRVLRKREDEETGPGEEGEEDGTGPISRHFWWLCEHSVSGLKGLVPRNYLGLYPTWKFRSRHPIDFELPQIIRTNDDQTEEGLTVEEESPEKEQEGKKGDENLNVRANSDRKSPHELSTYA